MPIHRVIFRLDYPLNYDLLDRPGQILRVLSEGREDFWDELGEDRQHRKIVAAYKGEQPTVFAVEPTTVNWSIEFKDGWCLDEFDTELEMLERMFHIVEALRNEFSLMTVDRVGFRVFYLSNVSGDVSNVIKGCRAQFTSAALASVESSLGEIGDYALAFDGSSVDGTKYRLRAGPYLPEQARHYFKEKELIAQFQNSKDLSFVCDLDQSERSIKLQPGFTKKWARPIITRAVNVIQGLESLINTG